MVRLTAVAMIGVREGVMINVAVLAGGRSPEHDISLLSAEQVLENLDRSRWRPWPVFLDRDGMWWLGERPLKGPAPSAWPVSSMRPRRPGAALEFLLEQCAVQIVLPALHGPFGEDGAVQGMLELHGVSFVGCGCAAAAVSMDKIRTRECLSLHGIPMPRAYIPEAPLRRARAATELPKIRAAVGLPCFLKVDCSGSTLGVAAVRDRAELEAFLAGNRGFGRRFLAEELVHGEEITVAVLGNTGDFLEALPPVGIYPVSDPYFSHAAKYQPGLCEEVVPPRGLDPETIEEVQELARRCHRALCCDGMSRTDMIVGADGPMVLEVNSIPGLTRGSLLPKAAAGAGMSLSLLLDRLLELALERSGSRG